MRAKGSVNIASDDEGGAEEVKDETDEELEQDYERRPRNRPEWTKPQKPRLPIKDDDGVLRPSVIQENDEAAAKTRDETVGPEGWYMPSFWVHSWLKLESPQ